MDWDLKISIPMFETETGKLSFSGPEFRMRHTPKHHQSHFDGPGRKMIFISPHIKTGTRLRPRTETEIPLLFSSTRTRNWVCSVPLSGPWWDQGQSWDWDRDWSPTEPCFKFIKSIFTSPRRVHTFCKLSGRSFATHVCLWCAGPPMGQLQQRSATCTDNYLRSWKYVRKVQSEGFLPISSGLLCWTSKEVQHMPCLFAFHVCL